MRDFVYRSLYLGFLAENRGRSVELSDLEDLLGGCPNLEVSTDSKTWKDIFWTEWRAFLIGLKKEDEE